MTGHTNTAEAGRENYERGGWHGPLSRWGDEFIRGWTEARDEHRARLAAEAAARPAPKPSAAPQGLPPATYHWRDRYDTQAQAQRANGFRSRGSY